MTQFTKLSKEDAYFLISVVSRVVTLLEVEREKRGNVTGKEVEKIVENIEAKLLNSYEADKKISGEIHKFTISR